MMIYIINLILISFWALLIYFLKIHNTKLGKSIFLVMTITQLILLQGLRSRYVGTDANFYYNFYSQARYTTLDDLLNHRFEVGFLLYNRLLAILGVNEQLFLMIVSATILIPLSIFLYKYSTNIYLSIYFYIAFGFFGISFNTLRQNIAYGMVLLSFKYINERKFLPFLAIILIGTSFHSSALVFLPAYFIARIKLTPIMLAGIGTVSVLLFLFRNQIMGLVVSTFFQDYSVVETGAFTWLAFNLILFIVTLFLYHKVAIDNKSLENLTTIDKKEKNKQGINNSTIRSFYILTLTGIILMIFSTVAENVMRIANYYFMFIIVLLPAFINLINNKYIKFFITMALFLGMALVYFYFLSTPSSHNYVPYRFFWY